jgi:hypothetical protein
MKIQKAAQEGILFFPLAQSFDARGHPIKE